MHLTSDPTSFKVQENLCSLIHPSPTSLLPKNESTEKYTFPNSGFIFYSILTSLLSFCVFFATIFIMFWIFSSAHTFNKEFYDSCHKSNIINIQDLLKLRTEIYDDQLIINELSHVTLDKVSKNLKAAIQDEITYKNESLNISISNCKRQEIYLKTCYNKRMKDDLELQSQNVAMVFEIYVPFSIILLLVIFIAFFQAKKKINFSSEQKKCYKILAIFFGCHVFIHLLILYSTFYDNFNNFKFNEIPSICIKDEPFLTEKCFFNGINCLEMYNLPKTSAGLQTLSNYIFWQILLFVLLIILLVFSEDRSMVTDGYEEV